MREVMHYSSGSRWALCGDGYGNALTTSNKESVTCDKCRDILASQQRCEAMAATEPKPDAVHLRSPGNTRWALCGPCQSADTQLTSDVSEVTCEACKGTLSTKRYEAMKPAAAEHELKPLLDILDTSKDPKPDVVAHPPHYTAGKVECIDAIEAATAHLGGVDGFLTGQVIKYVWRWKLKNGVQDLEKAKWYLERLIDRVKGGQS